MIDFRLQSDKSSIVEINKESSSSQSDAELARLTDDYNQTSPIDDNRLLKYIEILHRRSSWTFTAKRRNLLAFTITALR